MKVNNPYTGPSPSVDLFTQESTRRQARTTAGSAGPDRVHLSGDLRLAKAAVQAAAVLSEVRPEAVARGKALLETNEFGRDVERLADAMLAALTYPYDDDLS